LKSSCPNTSSNRLIQNPGPHYREDRGCHLWSSSLHAAVFHHALAFQHFTAAAAFLNPVLALKIGREDDGPTNPDEVRQRTEPCDTTWGSELQVLLPSLQVKSSEKASVQKWAGMPGVARKR